MLYSLRRRLRVRNAGRHPGPNRWLFLSHHTGKCSQMRTPSAKTKSIPLDTVITETLKLWRRHHLTYDQTRYVAKAVRQALACVFRSKVATDSGRNLPPLQGDWSTTRRR